MNTSEEFAMHRLAWRIRFDLSDPSQLDEAVRLLQAIIPRSIELLRTDEAVRLLSLNCVTAR